MNNLIFILSASVSTLTLFMLTTDFQDFNPFRNLPALNHANTNVVPSNTNLPQTPININITTFPSTTTIIITIGGLAGIVVIGYTLPNITDWANLPELFTQGEHVVNTTNTGLEIVANQLNTIHQTLQHNVLVDHEQTRLATIERLDRVINRFQNVDVQNLDTNNVGIQNLDTNFAERVETTNTETNTRLMGEEYRRLERLRNHNLSFLDKSKYLTNITKK